MAEGRRVVEPNEPPFAVGRHVKGYVGRIYGRNGHTLIVSPKARSKDPDVIGCDAFHSAVFSAVVGAGPGWSWKIVGPQPGEEPSILYCHLDVRAKTPVTPRDAEEEAWLDQALVAVKEHSWGVQRVVHDRRRVPSFTGKPGERWARHMITLMLDKPITALHYDPIDLTPESRFTVGAIVSARPVASG